MINFNLFSKCKNCGSRLCFFKDAHKIVTEIKQPLPKPEYYGDDFVIPDADIIHNAFGFYRLNCYTGYYYKPYRWNQLLEDEKQVMYEEQIKLRKVWYEILDKTW